MHTTPRIARAAAGGTDVEVASCKELRWQASEQAALQEFVETVATGANEPAQRLPGRGILDRNFDSAPLTVGSAYTSP